jgi:hypothetical protein
MMKEILDFLEYEKEEAGEHHLEEKKLSEYKSSEPNRTVIAVDGGCSTTVDGGTWNIAKLKVAAVTYTNGKKVAEEIDEYSMAAVMKGKKISFRIVPHVNLHFNPNSTNIEELPNLLRSILEWLKIKEMAEQSEKNTLILRDGAFGSNEAYEKSIINDVLETCRKKEVNLIGICKTSRAATESGRPLVGLVNEFGTKMLPEKKWLYTDGEMNIAKLHEMSGFCYRIETSHKDNLIRSLGIVSYYSKDPELLGYPYPLLKVDKIARVKDFEKEIDNAKLKLLARSLGKTFIEIDEKTTIMHSLLDKRAYR